MVEPCWRAQIEYKENAGGMGHSVCLYEHHLPGENDRIRNPVTMQPGEGNQRGRLRKPQIPECEQHRTESKATSTLSSGENG